MSKRYVVHPGFIYSKTDRQKHYITFTQLVRLYGVPSADCIDASKPSEMQGIDRMQFTHLHPRYDGRYSLPQESAVAARPRQEDAK